MNESCHIWMSHVTYEQVMSQTNESCHSWMSHLVTKKPYPHQTSHVTYESVMSHMNESCHIWMSRVTYEWVVSRINESCHACTGHVTYHMLRAWWCCSSVSHVIRKWDMSWINKSCYVWIESCRISHVAGLGGVANMSQLWPTRESCHELMSHFTYEWVMLLTTCCRAWWCR